jgi:hypothetical protein
MTNTHTPAAPTAETLADQVNRNAADAIDFNRPDIYTDDLAGDIYNDLIEEYGLKTAGEDLPAAIEKARKYYETFCHYFYEPNSVYYRGIVEEWLSLSMPEPEELRLSEFETITSAMSFAIAETKREKAAAGVEAFENLLDALEEIAADMLEGEDA